MRYIDDDRDAVKMFRCQVCDELKTKMWGDECNKCRRDDKTQELLKQIVELKTALLEYKDKL